MVHRFFSVFFFDSFVVSFKRSCPSGREDADARVSFRRVTTKQTVRAMIITVLVQGKCTTWSYLERGDA
mgnify:CR=1 FL=1